MLTPSHIVDWNIPKHLARFKFQDLPDGSTNVKVFPHDSIDDRTEAHPSETPFFQASIKPWKWVPSFPVSLGWLKNIGMDISLVQPPLPEGGGSHSELPGTDRWCKILPVMSSPRAKLAWIDMSQRDSEGALQAQYEHFWPGLGQWQLGVKMEDCVLDFPEGTHWHAPEMKL